MASDHMPAQTATVALLEDAVVGQALELLLRSTNCNPEFLAETVPEGSLDGAQISLLGLSLGTQRREDLSGLIENIPVAVRTPILRPVGNPRETQEWVRASLAPALLGENLKRRTRPP